MVFLVINNKTVHKIRLGFCSLILLVAFCYGTLHENSYHLKTNQNRVNFFKRNIYAVYSESSGTRTSSLGCLIRCVILANGYSTVCAGITLRRDGTSTVCTMLYPNVGTMPDLPTTKGADVIERGVKAYWYHPKIGERSFALTIHIYWPLKSLQ